MCSAAELERTIIYDSARRPSVVGNDAIEVSKAKVGFVAGGRPKFADEMSGLLRRRLTAAAPAQVVILAAAFVARHTIMTSVDTDGAAFLAFSLATDEGVVGPGSLAFALCLPVGKISQRLFVSGSR